MTRAGGWIAGHLVVALMWLLHWLPLPLLARCGEALGHLAWYVVVPRRRVCLANLAACFPEWPESHRRAIARRHFALFGRFVLEHGILWWASVERFRRLVTIEGAHHLDAHRGRPLIVLAPHFLGLDMGGARIAADGSLASMYQKQKNAVLDARILAGRMRFIALHAGSRLFSRLDGMLAIVRTVRQGVVFYYLPDMDLGARDAVFVPFFGVPAATITGVSRLAKLAGARVVPCVTEMLPGGAGYRVRFHAAWEAFPTDDPTADARRMNAFIEDQVRALPEQYYWLHKRFKTRPPGAPSLY